MTTNKAYDQNSPQWANDRSPPSTGPRSLGLRRRFRKICQRRGACVRVVTTAITASLLFETSQIRASDTNVILIPDSDTRGGAVFFVDECLTRGLTNSISFDDLRAWTTNTIQLYRHREAVLAVSKARQKQYRSVLAAEVPESIKSMQTRIPSCRRREPWPKDEGTTNFFAILGKAWGISEEEVEKQLRTIGAPREPPHVGFIRNSGGVIEAVEIKWYLYGIMVGPTSFNPDWKPWYERKLADGIYLWHGMK